MLLIAEEKNDCKRRCILHELEQEEALEAECEITDLDSPKKSSRALNPWLHSQNLSLRTRLGMALVTILGVALLAWLVVSPLDLMGASHLEKASYGPIFTTSNIETYAISISQSGTKWTFKET